MRMPDSYARPNSEFWKEWQIVILATKYTLSRYREHCISFTVNEELQTEAKRAQKHRDKDKSTKMAVPTAPTVKTAEKVERVQTFPPLIIPQ